MVLTLPAAGALIAAPVFLIDAFFSYAGPSWATTPSSRAALVPLWWGVPAFVPDQVLAPALFRREDTKPRCATPLVSVFIKPCWGAAPCSSDEGAGPQGFVGFAIATSIPARG